MTTETRSSPAAGDRPQDLDGRLAASPPSVARLMLVELRKLIDTRAGVALIIVGAVLIGTFGGGTLLFRGQPTIGRITVLAGTPAMMLIPVLATLLLTAERSQRTALITDALVPRRSRTLTAKLIAVLVSAVLTAALCLLAAVLIGAVGPLLSGRDVSWTVGWAMIGWFGVGMIIAALVGATVGMALGNAAAAIVIVLVWQALIFPLLSAPVVGPVLSWIDFGAVSSFLDGVTGREVGHALVGVTVWVLVPGVLGWIRLLRTEVR